MLENEEEIDTMVSAQQQMKPVSLKEN